MGDGEQYLKDVAERAKELGITEEDYARCRNPGDRRTPEKRILLQRIAERCRKLGIEQFKANY